MPQEKPLSVLLNACGGAMTLKAPSVMGLEWLQGRLAFVACEGLLVVTLYLCLLLIEQ